MSLDKFNFVKKVDKEEGKGLSTNDYTDIDQAEVQKLRTNKTKAKQIQVEDRGSTPPNSPDVQTALENIFAYIQALQVLDPDEVLNSIQNLEMDISNKVDKVSGKGLSTEDFTTAEKNKLSGIETGAQKNTVLSVNGKTGAVSLTKTDVGLGSVQNYGIATQAQAEAGTANDVYMTPLRVKEAVASLGMKVASGTYVGRSGTVNVGFAPVLVISVGANSQIVRLPQGVHVTRPYGDSTMSYSNANKTLTSTGFNKEAGSSSTDWDTATFYYLALG